MQFPLDKINNDTVKNEQDIETITKTIGVMNRISIQGCNE